MPLTHVPDLWSTVFLPVFTSYGTIHQGAISMCNFIHKYELLLHCGMAKTNNVDLTKNLLLNNNTTMTTFNLSDNVLNANQ